jgi:3',5'-nucleoside bisphosphate phosphatase
VIFRADMHIHSCLSPCASLEMSPKNIVKQAVKAKINAIVVADHNSARNSEVVAYECEKVGISYLYGLEANTLEEAHILCIFDKLSDALELSNILYESILPIKFDKDTYGYQVVLDKDENVIDMPDKLLSAPTAISINELQEKVLNRNGLFIPSHIDRPYYSVISQLGFLPPTDLYTAVEVSKFCFHVEARELAHRFKYVTNSDAHNLDDIGLAYTEFDMPNFTVDSIKKAIEENKIHQCFECNTRSDLL